MTPKDTHFGLLSQDALDEENEYFRQALADDYALLKLFQTSENGMIQFKKTRPEATKEGVKGARKLSKEEAVRQIHPLLLGVDPGRCNPLLSEKQDYIRLLQTFRPAQTVLETGIGNGTGNAYKKTKKEFQLNGENKESRSVQIMHEFRKVTKSALERNKPTLTVDQETTGDAALDEVADENDEGVIDDEFSGEGQGDGESDDGDLLDDTESFAVYDSKPRLSKSDKKKLKRSNASADEVQQYMQSKLLTKAAIASTSAPIGELSEEEEARRYQDPAFFMAYGGVLEDSHQDYVENALQPQSGLRGSEAMGKLIPLTYGGLFTYGNIGIFCFICV